MKGKRFEVWLADLNPQFGIEPGKIRPVVIVQTDLLNDVHHSTIICPLTTKIAKGSEILRVSLTKNEAGLNRISDVLADQLRAIDNKRFIKKLGMISNENQKKLIENISIILDIEHHAKTF